MAEAEVAEAVVVAVDRTAAVVVAAAAVVAAITEAASSPAKTHLELLNAPRPRGAFCIRRTPPAPLTTLLTFVLPRTESHFANW
jgi:hypothetical protein